MSLTIHKSIIPMNSENSRFTGAMRRRDKDIESDRNGYRERHHE